MKVGNKLLLAVLWSRPNHLPGPIEILVHYGLSLMCQGKRPLRKNPWRDPQRFFPASVGEFHLERPLKS